MSAPSQMTVEEYIKQDRQWLRHCRIAHAKYQLRLATDRDQQTFWQTVLDANQIGSGS